MSINNKVKGGRDPCQGWHKMVSGFNPEDVSSRNKADVSLAVSHLVRDVCAFESERVRVIHVAKKIKETKQRGWYTISKINKQNKVWNWPGLEQ